MEFLSVLPKMGIAINLVDNFFHDNDKTILWLMVANPSLGGLSPRDLIRLGCFKKLSKFIRIAINENNLNTLL